MKKRVFILFLIIFTLFINMNFFAQASENERVIVYFYSNNCLDCSEVMPYIDGLMDDGMTIIKYDIDEDKNKNLLNNYALVYSVPKNETAVPITFVGNNYFVGKTAIINAINSNEIQTQSLTPIKQVTDKVIVYFHSTGCKNCKAVAPYIDSLASQGITVIKYELSDEENINLMHSYAVTYRTPSNMVSVPLIYAGGNYYQSKDPIINAINNGTLQQDAAKPLLEVDLEAYKQFIKLDFWGSLGVMFSGFLDGFNPCALAMLLMFISLLGFTNKKKVLITISLSYILGLFLTYFALGTILYNVLGSIDISPFVIFINIFIITLSIILVVLNLYDFIVSKRQDYGKIKNQLPKGIQKFNKKIIKYFTAKLEEKSILIYILPFVLGVIISITEFLCTGQIYLPVIIGLIQYSETLNFTAILYLLMYNIFFILPLVVVAVISIKTTSVVGASNKIREYMHLIKLFNAILFSIVAIYYLLIVFKVI